jgi:hypothetical protein
MPRRRSKALLRRQRRQKRTMRQARLNMSRADSSGIPRLRDFMGVSGRTQRGKIACSRQRRASDSLPHFVICPGFIMSETDVLEVHHCI